MENPVINCNVVEVEPSSSIMPEALGISESRCEELMKQLIHIAIDEQRFSAILAKISQQCKHPNELAFISMQVGKMHNKKKAINPLEMFGE